jgi:hypothetical protein
MAVHITMQQLNTSIWTGRLLPLGHSMYTTVDNVLMDTSQVVLLPDTHVSSGLDD